MEGNVRLKLARREFFSGGGFEGSFSPISVKVKNIAFSKNVVVHYTPDGSTWKDVHLGFSSHFDDHDVFEGTVNEQVSQFVIGYFVDGHAFFDNNSGSNYRLDLQLAAVGGNVTLDNALSRQGMEAGGGFVFTTSWLEGEILVNNLSFVKEVGVRMSVDGGITWDDTLGTFSGSSTSLEGFIGPAEVWKFRTPELNLNSSSPVFRFAVFYRNGATGEAFWDNNFDQDYRVSKADGAKVG